MVLCSLLDPPMENETVITSARIVSLLGNAVDVRPFVLLQNPQQNFTLADYGTQFVTQVNTTGAWHSLFAPQILNDRHLAACVIDLSLQGI